MPQLDITTALLGCFAACTAYAFWLNSKGGKWFALNVTWASVILGVSIVLAWIATQPAHTAQVDLLFFIAGGLPIVVRSLLLTGKHLWSLWLYESRSGR